MSERAKPFVAWTWPHQLAYLANRQLDGAVAEVVVRLSDNSGDADANRIPCVVTPLLPDDPKVGEVWVDGLSGRDVLITGALHVDDNGDVWVPTSDGCRDIAFCHLRRKPVLKTFRMKNAPDVLIQAPSLAAARCMIDLGAMLEEVS